MATQVTAQQVKAANRRLYDAVAERYEEIDGRRSPALEAWLRKNLADIRRKAPGGRLLDIGTGSGLVTRCAAGLFSLRVGMDLSPRILAANRTAFDQAVASDVDRLPVADRSFDAVTCFSVLHHLYAFDGLVSEVARVLRPGGVFYSDHDMDASFRRRFRLLLRLYRRVRSAGPKYRRASEEITPEVYRLAEWQEEGVDSSRVVQLLEEKGFSVEAKHHWFGLSRLLDRTLGARSFGRGWAPLVSIVAVGGKR
ncbi:MAG: class I SAM-dependent methyltransferase [Planctomycetes bacterium]|nr:class I SAM-dependent methyltransferase [Planctomycetota bacterium]